MSRSDPPGAGSGGGPGPRHLRVRHRLGPGALVAAGEALLTWQVHAAAHVPLRSEAPRAAPGVRVRADLGPRPFRIPAPCRVVTVHAAPGSVGFVYRTLRGHVLRGEEAFTIEEDAGGTLWFLVESSSRPAHPAVALAWPLVPLAQRLYVRTLARGARRVVREQAQGGAAPPRETTKGA